eukprot:scaffold14648_cov101-Isochrysis_galbana.AAC.2
MDNPLSGHDGSILDDKALASRGTPEGEPIKLGRQPRATPPGPLVVRWDPVQCEGQVVKCGHIVSGYSDSGSLMN